MFANEQQWQDRERGLAAKTRLESHLPVFLLLLVDVESIQIREEAALEASFLRGQIDILHAKFDGIALSPYFACQHAAHDLKEDTHTQGYP